MVEGDDTGNGAAPEGAAPAADAAFLTDFQEFAAKADEKRAPLDTESDDANADKGAGADPAPEGSEKPKEKAEEKPEGAAPEEGAAPGGDKAEPEGKKEPAVEAVLEKLDRSNLSAEQRAAIDAAQSELHKLRSNAGRVPELQRAKAKLETQLAALANANRKPAEKPAPLLEDPTIKKAVEDLPELKPLAERLDRQEQQSAEDRARADANAANAAFGAAHPDFGQHKKAFNDWIRTQPEDLQAIATRNGKGIVNADEAIKLVELFKLDKQITTVAPAADPDPKKGEGAAPPNNLESRRKAQLDAARKGPEKVTGVDITTANKGYEDQFAMFANKVDARKQKRA